MRKLGKGSPCQWSGKASWRKWEGSGPRRTDRQARVQRWREGGGPLLREPSGCPSSWTPHGPAVRLASKNIVEHRPLLSCGLAHSRDWGHSQRGRGVSEELRAHRPAWRLTPAPRIVQDRAAATWTHLRSPRACWTEASRRQPCERRRQGHRCWFPSSQTHSWSEPASCPLPLAAPDLA